MADDDNFEPRERRQRRLRPRINMGALHPTTFRENFRLSVEVATALEDLISGTVAHDTGLNMALTPRQQLLVSLRFYATGAYLRLVGDGHGVSEATVCRAIHRVTDAIIHRCPGAITWPGDPAALGRLKEDFRQVAGLPDIVGCIDGTHVRLTVPREQREAYINRKGFPSLNVMAVAAPDRSIVALSVHCGGRVHDARVLATSGLPDYFRNGNPVMGAMMLGDSGYGLSPWLMTPIADPTTAEERAYNNAHARTRVVVENAFGVLKMRFGALEFGLRLKSVARCVAVIHTCFILHNMCIKGGDFGEWLGPLRQDEGMVQEPADGAAELPAAGAERRAGLVRRNDLVRLFVRH
ncbi:putative nuclease HARBI1 [Amphibalanus amphitrite]|uniref:putative nuclease HARBI1 n=1 Tax=Amphibalanus amphitrite TaxID=1232801 RepID=UPI001C906BC3|nr:putative nuclease HARBI1 [Amphibalanus amphitrite]